MQLKKKICRLSKFSNNVLELGDQEVGEWTFWITKLMLTREELNILVGDKYFDRALFNKRGTLLEPIDGWRKFERHKFTERYDQAVVTIVGTTDKREMEFRDAKIYGILMEPKTGGAIETSFKLQFRPGLGKENIILQEHQNHEITLTITDAKVALKKGGQQELGLDGEDAGDDEHEDSNGATPTPTEEVTREDLNLKGREPTNLEKYRFQKGKKKAARKSERANH